MVTYDVLSFVGLLSLSIMIFDFDVYPYCRVLFYFFYFWIFYCMDTSQFAYLFTTVLWWIRPFWTFEYKSFV
jgi:hypothetical protein